MIILWGKKSLKEKSECKKKKKFTLAGFQPRLPNQTKKDHVPDFMYMQQ